VLGIALERHGAHREAIFEYRVAETLFPDPLGRGKAREYYRAALFRAADSVKAVTSADSVRARSVGDSLLGTRRRAP
jgi:hypothetical protein